MHFKSSISLKCSSPCPWGGNFIHFLSLNNHLTKPSISLQFLCRSLFYQQQVLSWSYLYYHVSNQTRMNVHIGGSGEVCRCMQLIVLRIPISTISHVISTISHVISTTSHVISTTSHVISIQVMWSVYKSCDRYTSHVIGIQVMWSVYKSCDQYTSHVIGTVTRLTRICIRWCKSCMVNLSMSLICCHWHGYICRALLKIQMGASCIALNYDNCRAP